jgi:hypothetical protein
MRHLLRRGLESLLASFLKGYLGVGAKTLTPPPVKEALGYLFLTGMAGFGVYNIYTCLSFGVVYRLARRGGNGWITYTDDPAAFLFWTALYSVPLLIAGLVTFGIVSERRRVRRATFRQFVDGSGPAAIVRSWKDR